MKSVIVVAQFNLVEYSRGIYIDQIIVALDSKLSKLRTDKEMEKHPIKEKDIVVSISSGVLYASYQHPSKRVKVTGIGA